jgi:MscS family membrane protein
MALTTGIFSFKKLYYFALLAIPLVSPNVNAQLFSTATEEPKEAAAETIKDSLGRDNPRDAVNGYLKAMSDRNYMRASRYLNLKRTQQRQAERERIAKVLQRLLDQGGSLYAPTLLSNKETGRTDDDLAGDTDMVGSVTINGETIDLFVENISKDNEPAVWLFSRETVNTIAAVTTDQELLVDRILPQVLQDRLLAGVPLGHWIAVVILIAIAYLVSWGIIELIILLIKLFWAKARKEPTKTVVRAFSLPFRLYIAVWVFLALSQQVGISIIVRQKFSAITVAIGIIAILILLWRLADLISVVAKNKMSRHGHISAISIILFLRRTAKVALIVLGIIAILSAIGVDVTAGLAALGIGGLALALGAQKTIENFVGSVTLITDQPLRVGDFCKVGDISGTVEQIGMRSTKIRTGERTVVTIPNGDLSASRIENFAHRDRFLFAPTLELRADSTPDQVRYLLVELRALLYSHPMVNPDPAKVRFTGLGTSSLKLEVWAYIEAPGFDQFQEAQEDILLRIMDIVAASGTDFAFPSQTLYMARDKGISEEKANEAAETVRNWRENEELQLPSFDIDKINEIKNSIKYPPEGSVLHKKDDPTADVPMENKL